VLFSAGFETVFAEDSASDPDESVGDTSSQAEYATETETKLDTDHASENSHTARKASGELKVPFPHEIEWVDSVPEAGDREETDPKGVPDAPETTPINNRTRSGNLDAYYGK
jgi:hypothetical protein